MKNFVLLPARSFKEAALQAARPDTAIKAGGVDLLDRMKEGLDSPSRVVSISGIPGLDTIQVGSPTRIGALATLAKIASHPDLKRVYPALAAAAEGAATPQIRNMATLGGNICQRPRCWYYRLVDFDCRKKGGKECFAMEGENRFHAVFNTDVCCCIHPSAAATALLAYGARFQTVSSTGKREFSIEEFFVPPTEDATRENILRPGEIIETVVIPAPPPGSRSVYKKLKEKESFDWPLVETCVNLNISGGQIREARIVLGSVAPTPIRARKAEEILAGANASPSLAARAAEAAVESATPLSQNAYKVQLARVMLERTLKEALA